VDIHELSDLIRQGYGGRRLTALYTERTDSVVRDVFYSVFGHPSTSSLKKEVTATATSEGLCLIALGGYGRGELAPYSDIDIMLLAPDRSRAEEARQLLYKLWDAGLNISHSFRTASDCINEARKDIKTRTSLIEQRFIAGDEALYRSFKETVYPEVAFRNQRTYVTDKLQEVEFRHKRFGDSVFMLEPNVKEGEGGLREVHTVLWLTSVAFRIRHFDDLTKILSPDDFRRLEKAYDFMLKVRFCLHLLSGRRNDTLSFEFHEPAARLLNFRGSKSFYASERFMRYLYLKTAAISDVAAHALDKCSQQYIRFALPFTKRKISDNFSLSRDRIIPTREIGKDTDMMMEAFHVMSRTGKKFSPGLRDEIKKNLFRITGPARHSPRAVESFMSVLRGPRIYDTLSEMHRCGVLGRFLPEFGALSYLVVYEPFHRYTVDEHSLHAVRKLEELATTKYKSMEHFSAIFRRIKNKEALVLSLLLHDIGKRRITREKRFPNSDVPEWYHEGEGYREVKNITERFNLDVVLRNRVEFLVKNHIMMSVTAFKSETDDAEVIAQFAGEVADRENLDSLYLMTYADMASVAPDFWTDWKSYLLRELYETVSRYIEGFKEQGADHISRILSLSGEKEEEVKQFLSLMPDRYVISTSPDKIAADCRLSAEVARHNFAAKVEGTPGGTAEITVGAWDKPGLFSRIVGAISSLGLSIYRARVYTGKNGLVIDRIQVSNWKDIRWEGAERLLFDKLRNAVVTESAGEGWTRGERRTEPSVRPAFHRRFPPFVEIDNETSSEYSILEFFAQDRIGLLHDATSLLFEKEIDIISARINTEAGIAHDIFSVQRRGAKVEDVSASELLLSLWERLK
jgi:[protein-PII] uridylyltransferase